MRLLLVVFVACFGLAVAQPAPAFAEPPTTHEVIYTKPSGFWTSNKPAPSGNEYRWRLLGLACAILAVTGFGMYRLLRSADKQRAAREAQAPRS